MPTNTDRKLRVFLFHSSQDKPIVRELYQRLNAEGWIDPWMDEEDQEYDLKWKEKIKEKVNNTDVMLVCISSLTVLETGHEKLEFYHPWLMALKKPDGLNFIIPLRLDLCIPPIRFQLWHWLDYFIDKGYNKLLETLHIVFKSVTTKVKPSTIFQPFALLKEDEDFYQFINIPPESDLSVKHIFWVGKYPVTRAQYIRFYSGNDYGNEDYWVDFPNYDENCEDYGNYKDDGLKWYRQHDGLRWFKQQAMAFPNLYTDILNKAKPPICWDTQYSFIQPNNPIRCISWYEANAYCKWLTKHWLELPEFTSLSDLIIQDSNTYYHSNIYFRLPLETEWITAVKRGNTKPPGAYPEGRTPRRCNLYSPGF